MGGVDLKECSERCKRHPLCTYFLAGVGKKAGRCYWEKTKGGAEGCAEGWVTNR